MINPEQLAGALVGLAVGDAVGTTLEFTPHGDHGLQDMVGGGPFQLAPGQWTDDTSMALCLAESLLAHQRHLPADQLARYLRWYLHGENSSTGRCFDIGGTVRKAVLRYQETAVVYAPESDDEGNGSLMRMAPMPLFFWRTPDQAMDLAADQSRTTHGGRAAAEACWLWAALILAAAEAGATRTQVLDRVAALGTTLVSPPLRQITTERSYETKRRAAIRGSGWVVHSVEAALWAFWSTESFEAAVLAAANLGEDADTTAAIVGQLAGALYGLDGIPARWRSQLHEGARIEDIARALIAAQDRV